MLVRFCSFTCALLLGSMVSLGCDETAKGDPAQEEPCSEVDCGDFGDCVDNNGLAACLCDSGYHAEDLFCVEDQIPDPIADPCDNVSCGDFGDCADKNGKAVCLCDDGYHVQDLVCVEDQIADPCTEVDCGQFGDCANDGGTAICNCDDGYHVQEMVCIVTNVVNPCDGVSCGDYGSCSDDGLSPTCDCDDGYESENLTCVEIDLCKGVGCGIAGSCVVEIDEPACECDLGYHDDNLNCVADDLALLQLNKESGLYNANTTFDCVTVTGQDVDAQVFYTLSTDGSTPADPTKESSILLPPTSLICGIDQNGTTTIKLRQFKGETVMGAVSMSVFNIDTTAPSISAVTHDASGTTCIDFTIHFTLNSGETSGEATVEFGVLSLELFDDGTHGDAVADDGVYELDYKVLAGNDMTNQIVVGHLQDAAGNEAAPVSASNSVSIDTVGTVLDGAIYTSANTWSPVHMPYIIESDILVKAGASLTIEPGTCVVFRNETRIVAKDTLNVTGTASDHIVIKDGILDIQYGEGGNVAFDAGGNYVNGPRFEYIDAPATDVVIMYEVSPYIRFCELNNLVGVFPEGWSSNAGGAHFDGAYIYHSSMTEVYGDWFGSSHWPVYLRGSKILNSYIGSLELGWSTYNWEISNCDIEYLELNRFSPSNVLEYNNLGSVTWENPRSSPAMKHNNFYGTDAEYLLEIVGESTDNTTVDATENYWGPTAAAQMNDVGQSQDIDLIYDLYDDFDLSEVTYDSWLSAPIAAAGPSWTL